ncbi:hypothetical protein HanXRQr2_Chr10g0424541 [Helianthus annuus]|uniref:Uncharacterized protein n=1 Tax=Helianthus annuus TaxID=4232 RepID=A0A9K3HV96_HELAN|nr:hypothetical protein HanXRQr2_Chr10g0424541 [Helianthus annuus]
MFIDIINMWYQSSVDYVNSIKKFDVDDLFLMIVLSSLIVTKKRNKITTAINICFLIINSYCFLVLVI